MSENKRMTTDAGRPVGDNQNSLTVGSRGPVVFEDFLLFEKMAHFNRERIPERVVHAKGSFGGATQDPAFRERPRPVSGTVDRHNHRLDGDYYTQPGNLFRLMKPDARERLIGNIAASLKNAPWRIQELQVQHFFQADPAYGAGVANALGLSPERTNSSEDKFVAAD